MIPALRNLYALPIALALSLSLSLSIVSQAQDEQSEAPGAAAKEKVDFKKLKSPIPYTKKSISRGKMLFMRTCTECHGTDGKSQMDVVADATDLTVPKAWLSGITEGEVFRSIRDGAGVSMPPFSFQIRREEDMWHLANYVRSLWPKSMQPQLQEEAPPEQTTIKDEQPSDNGGQGREENE